jgi:pimeloyl-ACP methyl ester carboxylesterase
MRHSAQSCLAITTKTQLVESNGRALAYRSLGSGKAFVLCNRSRGNLDSWDPAFVDDLARDFHVILFDYSGLGRSTGQPSCDPQALAQDVVDLATALHLEEIVIGGWSLGGITAQVVIARYPERFTHAVLIGTRPLGPNEYPPQNRFFETALKPTQDLEDEIVLFFDPKSQESRDAAKRSHERIARRTTDLDFPIPAALLERLLSEVPGGDPHLDSVAGNEKLEDLTAPLLVLSGDRDIAAPVENWYARSRDLPTMQLVVFPSAGHGPQHQFPEACADTIATFVRTEPRETTISERAATTLPRADYRF